MDFNSAKLYDKIKKIFSVIERSMNSFYLVFLQRVKVYVCCVINKKIQSRKIDLLKYYYVTNEILILQTNRNPVKIL